MAKRKKLDSAALDKCLAQQFTPQDIGEEMTVREYLKRLLQAVLREGESFSGKRPFGNSGWEDNLVIPMIQCDLLKGTINDDDPDYLEAEGWDWRDYDAARDNLVERVFAVS